MSGLPQHPNLYPAEIAKFLRINVRTVYDMISYGYIPAIQVGRQFRIPRDRFIEWYDKKQKNSESDVAE